MISHKHKCIFVHIPKTGGTSVTMLVWPRKKDRTEKNLWKGFVSKYHNKYQTGGLQHLQARHIKQELGAELFDRYFKFSIVRNPWDKAVSQFVRMQTRKDLRDFIGMSKDDCFKKYLALIRKKPHVQWESQYKFIMDDSQKLMVDFLGRFESFKGDVRTVLDKLNLNRRWFGFRSKKIPHLNKSFRSSYQDYYDSESKEIVQHIYKTDIMLFDYTF